MKFNLRFEASDWPWAVVPFGMYELLRTRFDSGPSLMILGFTLAIAIPSARLSE